jgi:hypothetical protein
VKKRNKKRDRGEAIPLDRWFEMLNPDVPWVLQKFYNCPGCYGDLASEFKLAIHFKEYPTKEAHCCYCGNKLIDLKQDCLVKIT